MHIPPLKTSGRAALCALGLLWAGSGPLSAFEVRDLVDLVNPRYGNDTSTVIGPQVPWGSVNPSPNSEGGAAAGTDGFRWDQQIKGFSQLHVSGTGGWGAYGNLLLSPQIGLAVGDNQHSSPHSQTDAKAYRFRTHLDRYNITAEFTPTHNATLYRFTYPASSEAHLLLDAGHTIPRDIIGNTNFGTRGGQVTYDPATNKITGWGTYFGSHVDATYTIYFAARASKTPTGYGTFLNAAINPGQTTQSWQQNDDKFGTFLKFSTTADEVVSFKIAVSFQSIQKAEQFLDEQIPAWDFEAIVAACAQKWNEVLSTVLIDDPTITPNQLTQFYNNLYHTFMMPRNRTGDSPLWSGNDPYYDDQYCIWDTFRTLYPLHVILKESFVRDNILCFIKRHVEDEPFVSDTFIGGDNRPLQQAGDNVDCIIADAFAKGVSGVDWDAAYSILKYHADNMRLNDFGPNWTPAIPGDPGSSSYRLNDRGWRPYEETQRFENSDTLEYAFNDFCIALVANGLGRHDDRDRYLARSGGWENNWNPSISNEGYSGFIQPRYENGTWRFFDPNVDLRDWSPQAVFYEGTSWRYSYFVPHNMDRLVQLKGGATNFVNRTVHYFENDKHDSGNEPTFLVSRAFNYAGRPDLSAKYTREVMADFSEIPIGPLPGDDDSGAMGAWFTFGVMGFMPVAGTDVYLINSPKYRKLTIQMENGHDIVIHGPDANQPDALYVQSATLNGAPLNNSWFRHADIKNGAVLDFTMGTTPSTWAHNGQLPPSGADIFSTTLPPAPAPADRIRLADAPSSIRSGSGRVAVTVHYALSAQRDLLVEVFDQNWNFRGNARVENITGNGVAQVAVDYAGLATADAILIAKLIEDEGTAADLIHEHYIAAVPVNGTSFDQVLLRQLPLTVNPSGQLTASVEYATSEPRDLLLEVFDEAWNFKGNVRLENLDGNGVRNATLNFAEITSATAQVVAKLVPLGGDAQNMIDDDFVGGVLVGASAQDKVLLIDTPAAIPNSGMATVWVEYTTTTTRDALIEVFDANWNWKGNVRVENLAGSGVFQATVNASDIGTPTAILIVKLISDGGTWQNMIDEHHVANIPATP